jgi:hypothetical protein
MTGKIYKTAQGKTIDLGTIILQNEHVRAVGNMNVNARGDKLDSNNRVIETKPRQVQRQNARVTNVGIAPVQTSSNKNKRKKNQDDAPVDTAPVESSAPEVVDPVEPVIDPTPPVVEEPPQIVSAPPVQNVKVPAGGLAAAIARSREIKQELEKTPRQQRQSQGLRKI